MKFNFFAKALCLCLMLVSAAFADEASVKKDLLAKFSDMPIQSIRKTPFAGIYEVYLSNNQIIYTGEKADFMIVGGSLIDTKTRTNITEARMQDLTRVKFDALPFESAIKIVRGNGKRKLAVFEDPDCPYCKQLEKELLNVTDITLYVFLYPLDGLHPGSSDKSRAVWCAPDRAKAWNDLMHNGTVPQNKGTCDNPIASLAELAPKLKIFGTPAIIFEDGRMIPGAVPAAQLEIFLNGKPAAANAKKK